MAINCTCVNITLLPIADNHTIKLFTLHRAVTKIGNFHYPSVLTAAVSLPQAHMIHSVLKLNVLIQVVVFTVILQILYGLGLGRECGRVWREGEVMVSHQLVWKVGSTSTN